MKYTERKEKILRCHKAIPIKNLINYIKIGDVTLDELIEAGLPKDRELMISDYIKNLE